MGQFITDEFDGALSLSLFDFLLFSKFSGSIFKLVVERRAQNISQHLLALICRKDGELVGMALSQVGAVIERFVVHVQDVSDLLFRFPDSSAREYLIVDVTGY